MTDMKGSLFGVNKQVSLGINQSSAAGWWQMMLRNGNRCARRTILFKT